MKRLTHCAVCAGKPASRICREWRKGDIPGGFAKPGWRRANIDLYNLRKNGVFVGAEPFRAVTADAVQGELSNTHTAKDEHAQEEKAKSLDREVWRGL